jgi:uncharacterized protein YdhG (YjbR/CyaY superfamily)
MMKATKTTPKDIDEYIGGFPQEIQEILQKVRETIRKAAPKAEETISYNMPTFNLHGHYLIYFAGFKRHISLYPAPIGVPEFQEEIAPYESGKGTLKFPLDKPIPYGLIRRIVKHRIKENEARVPQRRKK